MRNVRFWAGGLAVILAVLSFTGSAAAQGKLVFSQGPNGNELWVRRLQRGAYAKRILTMPSYIVTPRWSGDGKRIAFQSGTQLWIVNEDGTGLRNLPGIAVADAGLTWDSNGTGLIYAQLCVCCEYLRSVDADGFNDQVFYQPSWGVLQKPDARPGDALPSSRVTFHHTQCGQENLPYTFFGTEMSRQGGTDFTAIPGAPDVTRQQFARWSKDGTLLITSVRIESAGEWALEIVDPFHPDALRERFLQGPGNFGSVDFGCSTQVIYFTRSDDGYRDVWRVEANLPPQQVTELHTGTILDLAHYCPK